MAEVTFKVVLNIIVNRLKSNKQVLHAKGPFSKAEILSLHDKFLKWFKDGQWQNHCLILYPYCLFP